MKEQKLQNNTRVPSKGALLELKVPLLSYYDDWE